MQYPILRCIAMKKIFFVLGFVLYNNINAQIKSIGSYPIKNYSVNENEFISATNAIVQIPNGAMLFGNSKGITLFDGINWQLIKLPNNSGVFSLAVDKKGTVFVGAMNEFGYLQYSFNGEIEYVSLVSKLDEKYRDLGIVTRIFESPDGILFVCNNELIIYNNNKCSVIQPAIPVGRAIKIDSNLILIEESKSFHVLKNRKLQTHLSSELVDCSNIFSILKWKGNGLLLISNILGTVEFRDNQIKLVQTIFNDFIKKNKIISSISLRNGFSVLGSMHNGAIIIDPEGIPVQIINKENGLDNNKILDLFEDKHGNLWIGHDLGISFVEISSPFTFLLPQEQGNGLSAKLYNNQLYLGTSQGLFWKSWQNINNNIYHENKTQRVEKISGQVWNLKEINKKLYACSNEGSYVVDKESAQKIPSQTGTWDFRSFFGNKDEYFQGTYSGLNMFTKGVEGITFNWHISGFNKSCRIFEKDEYGYIWVTHGYEGVFRLKPDSATKSISEFKFYGEHNGFPSNLGINVYRIKNKLLFTSEHGGIYEYNYEKDTFLLYTEFEKHLGKYPQLSKLYEDNKGNIWFIEMHRTGIIQNNGYGVYTVIDKPFSDLSKTQIRGFELIYIIDSQNVVLGSTKGFLHYNPQVEKEFNIPFNAIIRKVEIIKAKDSVVFNGFKSFIDLKNRHDFRFPHKFNSLRFNYAAPFFENIDEVKYSCYLEGFDKTWSEWGNKIEREYTNLPGGDYVFHVRAKNIYNEISTEDTFEFYLRPHFTRTLAAFIIYVIALIILVVVLAKFYSKKKIDWYKKQSLKKEQEIIKLKNQQLQSEVEYKNKELGSMTMQMIKKNEAFFNIKNKLDELYPRLQSDVKSPVSIILKTIESEVNSEKDWEYLQVNFDSVYIGFLKRLKELFPDLKSSELQMCAYIRMGLSNKEIATLMNSTTRGIEGYRYRLRKNLNLEHDENIKDFLFNLIQ